MTLHSMLQFHVSHREISSRQSGVPSEKLAGESGLSFSKARPKQQHSSHWQGAKWIESGYNDIYT